MALNIWAEQPKGLAQAVFLSLGAASVCWEHPERSGIFDSTRAKEIGDDLIAWIEDRLHRDTLVQIFQDAWNLADQRGEEGHRTEAGIDAVLAHVLGPAPVDPGQPPIPGL